MIALKLFSYQRDVAQLGRAPRSGRGGREFKSRHPDEREILKGQQPQLGCCPFLNDIIFESLAFISGEFNGYEGASIVIIFL